MSARLAFPSTPEGSRDVTGIALQLMSMVTNPETIALLLNSIHYRHRTSILFGVTWPTEDGHTYWASQNNSKLERSRNNRNTRKRGPPKLYCSNDTGREKEHRKRRIVKLYDEKQEARKEAPRITSEASKVGLGV